MLINMVINIVKMVINVRKNLKNCFRKRLVWQLSFSTTDFIFFTENESVYFR